jgi:hypothetical protein
MMIFPRYMFLQPRSFEGASGVRPKAERGAASRAPCLASTALGRPGTRPGGTTTLTRSVRYRDDSHAQRQCWKRAVSGSATPEPENRRAERRWAQRPFAKGARTPAKACNLLGANRRSAPRLSEGQRPALLRRKHDGHRGADQRPRRISHGCLTSELDDSAVGRGRPARRAHERSVIRQFWAARSCDSRGERA